MNKEKYTKEETQCNPQRSPYIEYHNWIPPVALYLLRRLRSFTARLLDERTCCQMYATTILSSTAKFETPALEDTELLRLDTSFFKQAPREHHASKISRRPINAAHIQGPRCGR